MVSEVYRIGCVWKIPIRRSGHICQLLTKVQPYYQSNNNRNIDLYSKYRESKLQVLTKIVVTYKKQNGVWSRTLYHPIFHEQGNRLLGKFFLLLPFFTTYEGEICQERLIE